MRTPNSPQDTIQPQYRHHAPLGSWPPVLPSITAHTLGHPHQPANSRTGPRPALPTTRVRSRARHVLLGLQSDPRSKGGQSGTQDGAGQASAGSPGPSHPPGLGADSSSAPRASLWGTAFYTRSHRSPLGLSACQTSSTEHRALAQNHLPLGTTRISGLQARCANRHAARQRTGAALLSRPTDPSPPSCHLRSQQEWTTQPGTGRPRKKAVPVPGTGKKGRFSGVIAIPSSPPRPPSNPILQGPGSMCPEGNRS